MQICKYPLSEILNTIELPYRARFMHVGLDPVGLLCAWYMVEDDGRGIVENKKIRIYGTGEEDRLLEVHKYLGTVTRGQFVWHCFEIIE